MEQRIPADMDGHFREIIEKAWENETEKKRAKQKQLSKDLEEIVEECKLGELS